MTTATATARPIAFSAAMGVLGAAAIISVRLMTHRAPLAILPYMLLVVATAAWLRAERVAGFIRRFAMALAVLMTATVIFYLFEAIAHHTLLTISAWGHTWRFGIALAIFGVISLAVAQITSTATQ